MLGGMQGGQVLELFPVWPKGTKEDPLCWLPLFGYMFGDKGRNPANLAIQRRPSRIKLVVYWDSGGVSHPKCEGSPFAHDTLMNYSAKGF